MTKAIGKPRKAKALTKAKMDKASFTIRMYRTITDPVERRHRLARLYSFFEHPFEDKSTSGQPNPVMEVATDSQLDEPGQQDDFITATESTDENQLTAL
ncbi:MAG: hypothetical protein HS114_00560 [Anaerolineales bacterium]|nr:hypothetical protein [Anaerolineales bacterium]